MADDNVNSPAHYKYGKKETIDVIREDKAELSIKLSEI